MNDVMIRPITYDDTDLIVKWRNQEDIRSRFFYREEFTSATHEQWMRNKVSTGEVVQFIIVDKVSDRPIGSTYLRDIDQVSKSAEYGVFIGDSSMRGKGIGKRVLALTLDYAWNELRLDKVRARAMADNTASVQSFLRLGFDIVRREDGVTCSDGERKDMVWMEIHNEKKD